MRRALSLYSAALAVTQLLRKIHVYTQNTNGQTHAETNTSSQDVLAIPMRIPAMTLGNGIIVSSNDSVEG